MRGAAILLLSLTGLSAVALTITTISFNNRLQQAQVASTDNQTWLVVQLQIDLQNFLLGMERLNDISVSSETADAFVAQVEKAYDILYSRITTVIVRLNRLDLPDDDRLSAKLARLIALRAAMTEQVDALSASRADAFAALIELTRQARPLVRDITTSALENFVQIDAQTREDNEKMWRDFSLLAAVLMILMLGAIGLTVALWRGYEKRVRDSETMASHLKSTFEASHDAVIISDADGRIVEVNSAARRIFGFPRERMVGAAMSELVLPDDIALKNDPDAIFGPGPGNGVSKASNLRRLTGRRADGSDFPAEISFATDRDSAGQRILIAFVRDITHRVKAERQLKAAVSEARQHAEAKSRFLAVMSHEMRTPLHGVIAALDLMAAGRNGADEESHLRTAQTCADRALAQVNDVLSLTDLNEAEKPPAPFSPVETLESLVDSLRPLALTSGNRLHFRVQGLARSAQVLGQPQAFFHAVNNLLGNAIKFTRDGRVDVCLAAQDHPEGLRIEVTVADTGIGIAPEDQDRIFGYFETLKLAGTDEATGTGLGLAIVRRAVEQMGGTLSLDSRLGQGSRFRFDMLVRPIKTAAAPDATAAPLPDLAKCKCLVVDDNPINRQLLFQMLQRLGATAELAKDGAEAVRLATETGFDLILMDVRMPVMGGVEATRCIRRNGASRQSRIIGVSASNAELETGIIDAQDFDGVLGKPFTLAQLGQVIAATGPRPAGEAVPPSVAAMADELARLLGEAQARQILDSTIAQAGAAVAALRDPRADTDAQIDAVHLAAGSAGLCGLSDICDMLQQAERVLQKGDRVEMTWTDRLAAGIDDLGAALARLRAENGQAAVRPM